MTVLWDREACPELKVDDLSGDRVALADDWPRSSMVSPTAPHCPLTESRQWSFGSTIREVSQGRVQEELNSFDEEAG